MIAMPDPSPPFKLTYKHKLVARTTPQLVHWANHLVNQLRLEGMEIGDRAVSVEAILNGMYLFFKDRPVEEQLRLLWDYVPRFEAMLEGDPGAQRDAPGTGTTSGGVVADVDGEAPRRKGRKGA